MISTSSTHDKGVVTATSKMWQEFLSSFFVVNAAYESGIVMNTEERRAYQWKYYQAILTDFLVKENRWSCLSEYKKVISRASLLTMKGSDGKYTV